MSDGGGLGERMKGYEQLETGRRLPAGVPICARLDGKGFRRWAEGLSRPYDLRLSHTMSAVAARLVEETQARIAYTHSDEISLLWFSTDARRQLFLDRRIHKLVSILASMCTAWFNTEAAARIPERAGRAALFDCRVWSLPTREEAANALLWRERDAAKNALSMAAREHYSAAQLAGQQAARIHAMLREAGVDWRAYPSAFTRGVFVRHERISRPFAASLSPAQREALPAQHEARRDAQLQVMRGCVRVVEMPPFHRVRNRVEVIFEGAQPLLAEPPGGLDETREG